LSGGLDSGLVTTTAARFLGERGASLRAFTSAPSTENPVFLRPGWDADDAPFAAQVAAFHPNIEHLILRSDGRAAIDLLPQMHQRSGSPVRNGSNHLWLDSIARSAGPGVLLIGARGNFSLSYSGNGGSQELLRKWQWRAAIQHAVAFHQGEGRPSWRAVLAALQPPALRAFRNRAHAEKIEYLSLTISSFRAQHRDVLRPRRPKPGTRASFVRSMTLSNYVWAADPLPMWGLEWRDPTADRRLLELLLSFPLAAFAPEGCGRGLAREIGRGLLPDAIRLRKTRGGQSMDYAANMARALPRYHDACDRMAASSTCRSLFDMDLLRKSLERVRAGETSGALTSPIDRSIDAGLFLLEQEIS
jgi:asparagine synthase (glutamine-hydrolysing)